MAEAIKSFFRKSMVGRYLFAGGSATAVNLGLLYVFTDLFGVWYLYSSIMAFVIAFGVSFVLQKWWTFADHSMDRTHHQLFHYLLVALVNLFINSFIMYLLVDRLHLWYLLAQVIASASIAVGSFFVYRHGIFKIR